MSDKHPAETKPPTTVTVRANVGGIITIKNHVLAIGETGQLYREVAEERAALGDVSYVEPAASGSLLNRVVTSLRP